jgi:putative heme-binding domain-containing protein
LATHNCVALQLRRSKSAWLEKMEKGYILARAKFDRRLSVRSASASLLVLLSVLIARGQMNNPHATPADRAAGSTIFRSHCASCHGVKGTGGLGPSLITGSFFHGGSDADLYRNISEGIAGTAMPGAFFDGTQLWQIVAFVRSLNQTATSGSVPGNARRGGQLFRQQGCISCHLARGEGGAKGPDLSVIGSQRSAEHLRESILDPDASVSPEFWVAKIVMNDGSSHSGFVMNQDTYMVQILDFSRGLRSLSRSDFKDFGIDRSSIMPSYKGKLSETELDDLVNYLLSLQRQPGRSE